MFVADFSLEMIRSLECFCDYEEVFFDKSLFSLYLSIMCLSLYSECPILHNGSQSIQSLTAGYDCEDTQTNSNRSRGLAAHVPDIGGQCTGEPTQRHFNVFEFFG